MPKFEQTTIYRKAFAYLNGQFARRCKYQCLDPIGSFFVKFIFVEKLQHRKCKSGRFAVTRLGASKYVAAFEQERYGLLLNRCWRLVAFGPQRLYERLDEPQIFK